MSFMKLWHFPKLLMCCVVCCVSCGDDPESLAAESRLQSEKLELESHLGLVREEITGFSRNLDQEIEAGGRTNSSLEEQLTKEQEALGAVNEEIRNLRSAFDQYRQDHPVDPTN
jgi:chromosome segregation ATPase